MTRNQYKNDTIVLSFHESLLRKSDIQLLQGPHWLNDRIISFYLEYLEKQEYGNMSSHLFVSPEVTQCIKIIKDDVSIFLEPLNASEKLFVFFPINNHNMDSVGGTHWSLLVYSRPENTFWHFDSFNASNFWVCQSFINNIKSSLKCDGYKLHNVDCLQQSNGYDCGIHVLCTVKKVTEYTAVKKRVAGVPNLTKDAVKYKRQEILEIINDLGGNTE